MLILHPFYHATPLRAAAPPSILRTRGSPNSSGRRATPWSPSSSCVGGAFKPGTPRGGKLLTPSSKLPGEGVPIRPSTDGGSSVPVALDSIGPYWAYPGPATQVSCSFGGSPSDLVGGSRFSVTSVLAGFAIIRIQMTPGGPSGGTRWWWPFSILLGGSDILTYLGVGVGASPSHPPWKSLLPGGCLAEFWLLHPPKCTP